MNESLILPLQLGQRDIWSLHHINNFGKYKKVKKQLGSASMHETDNIYKACAFLRVFAAFALPTPLVVLKEINMICYAVLSPFVAAV